MHQTPFIVLDGIDGTGKSTQIKLLVEWLHTCGIAAIACSDPGSTPLGEKLRALLLDRESQISLRSEALLFMASRAELVESVIRPALETSKVVICDRFSLANVVYQGHAGGLSPDDLRSVGEFATGGLQPNITFVLDLPLELAMARRSQTTDRLEARDRCYHERVREGFLQEARAKSEAIQIVDASLSVDSLQAILRERLVGLFRALQYPFSAGCA